MSSARWSCDGFTSGYTVIKWQPECVAFTTHLCASSCQRDSCINTVSLWPAVICVPQKKRIFVNYSNWKFLIFCVFTSICRLDLLILVSSCVLCYNRAKVILVNDRLNWLLDRSIDPSTNRLTSWPSERLANESISCGYYRKSFGRIRLIWFSHDFSPKCAIICRGDKYENIAFIVIFD